MYASLWHSSLQLNHSSSFHQAFVMASQVTSNITVFQQLFGANNKENIVGPLWGETTIDWCWWGKRFHVMTSSCVWISQLWSASLAVVHYYILCHQSHTSSGDIWAEGSQKQLPTLSWRKVLLKVCLRYSSKSQNWNSSFQIFRLCFFYEITSLSPYLHSNQLIFWE